jgi:hypothetical protein
VLTYLCEAHSMEFFFGLLLGWHGLITQGERPYFWYRQQRRIT